MSPYVSPVISSETLPKSADVVIIGGGIVGAAAWHLAKRGVSVALCEKDVIGGEQSSRNWGYCRQQGRDPAELPLIKESMRQWETMAEDLGEDVGYRRTGVHYLAANAAGMKRYEDLMPHAREYGLDTRLLSAAEAAEALPGVRRSWYRGMVTPSDGSGGAGAGHSRLCACDAEGRGGAFSPNCAVRGLETSAGRVSAVVTEAGPIATQSVLLAGGARSSLFCRRLGIDLPQLTVRLSVMRIHGGPDLTQGGAWTPKFALRRRIDGGYTIAHGGHSTADITLDSFRYFFRYMPILMSEWCTTRLSFGAPFFESLRCKTDWALDATTIFEEQRILDPKPSASTLKTAWTDLVSVFPGFENVEIAERWGGYMDTTPDVVPVISPVASLPGFHIATGFSGHGVGIGPGAGRLAADLVTGATPCVDPAPFALSRLASN
ncbi:FAD-binding oxidoreductase [Breoghania sp.]|uniref:NAD(P)/FAD-dependent oxidoreductase n=1 Tax=Breoghania sp. TaxID=2065378 RepID=UPI00263A1060|nr:FAD-binding oxidoreductase [Breoghania sp.]MDJ0931133.1 FAD-binding oxidoreductase [Breoghania sp.]